VDLFSEGRLCNRWFFDQFSLKKFFIDFAANLHVLVVLVILNLPKINDSAALGIDDITAFGHEVTLDPK
jgi:hypothetical protein